MFPSGYLNIEFLEFKAFVNSEVILLSCRSERVKTLKEIRISYHLDEKIKLFKRLKSLFLYKCG